MNCEICKVNEAGIHFQEIINGNKMSLHLCHVCAEKKDIKLDHFKHINITKIMSKLSLSDPVLENNVSKIAHLKCPFCKMTGRKFEQVGRFGCEHCYTYFRDFLDMFLPTIHKGVEHIGKKIEKSVVSRSNQKEGSQNEFTFLQEKLSEAVKHENFELAVELRDQIKNHKELLED